MFFLSFGVGCGSVLHGLLEWLVGPYFPNQGLNPGPGGGNTES